MTKSAASATPGWSPPTGASSAGSSRGGTRTPVRRTILRWPEGNSASHHFVAMERPDAFAADLRTFFAKVR
ncbi:hypothetical protein ACFP2T_39840 [Plantactinospora solaniradicis]|uniref:Alpha/beta hydrolase n=1 Tax=Plantactinospora solaniradicis TaxID=1723736 RepID=A0ABW1KP70_9ACTN